MVRHGGSAPGHKGDEEIKPVRKKKLVHAESTVVEKGEDDESFSLDSDDINKSMNSDEIEETRTSIRTEIDNYLDIFESERGMKFEHKGVLNLMMHSIVDSVQRHSNVSIDPNFGAGSLLDIPVGPSGTALLDIEEEESSEASSSSSSDIVS